MLLGRRLLGPMLLGLMLLGPFSAAAQSGMDQIGSARAVAMGRATTALPGDAGSHANPAAADPSYRTVHVFAHESFGLAAMRRAAIDLVLPAGRGALLAHAGTFGFEAYRESYFSLGAAYPFRLGTSRAVQVGLHARYYHTAIEGYGRAGTVGFTLGTQVPLLPSLTFGALATNLNAPQLADDVPLPQSLAVGLAYQAAPPLMVVLDAIKALDAPLSVRGGIEVRPLAPLAVRAGATTAPTRFSAGAGVRLRALSADLAAERHQTLGWSPSVGFTLYW